VIVTKRQTLTYVEVSDIIRAPREKVFSLGTDFASWPKIYPHIKSVRVLRYAHGEILLELESSVGGRLAVAQRTRPSEKIVEDMKGAQMRGKTIYTFEALPQGTRVTLEFDARLKGLYKILGPFVKAHIRKRLMKQVIGPMKRAAEDPKLKIHFQNSTQMREQETSPELVLRTR
jgi:uncharacterized membrane protein